MTGKGFIDAIMRRADKFQNLTTDTDYRALALDWLNVTGNNIATRQTGYHWRWLEKTAYFETVADQMSYDLPTDIDGYKIVGVHRKEGDWSLSYQDQRVFDEYVPDPSVSGGDPTVYTLWASAIKLWPIPASVIDVYIRYVSLITALTDSDDSDWEIPTKWNDVVIQGALVEAYKLDNKLQLMAMAKQEYENGIRKMQEDNGMIIDYRNVAKSHDERIVRTPFVSPAGQ